MHCVFIYDFKCQVWRRLHCKQEVNRVKITRNCHIWINNTFWKNIDDFQQPQRQTLQDWSLVVYCWAGQTEPTVKVTKHDIREWRKPFWFKWPFLELHNLESHGLQLKQRRAKHISRPITNKMPSTNHPIHAECNQYKACPFTGTLVAKINHIKTMFPFPKYWLYNGIKFSRCQRCPDGSVRSKEKYIYVIYTLCIYTYIPTLTSFTEGTYPLQISKKEYTTCHDRLLCSSFSYRRCTWQDNPPSWEVWRKIYSTKTNNAYLKRKSIRIRLVVKVSCTCTWVKNLLHCFHVHKGQHNKCISKWYSVIDIIDMQSTSNRRGSHPSRWRSKAMRCPFTYSASMLQLHAWMLMTDVNLCCQNNVLNA